jgi:hypothetical protein
MVSGGEGDNTIVPTRREAVSSIATAETQSPRTVAREATLHRRRLATLYHALAPLAPDILRTALTDR